MLLPFCQPNCNSSVYLSTQYTVYKLPEIRKTSSVQVTLLSQGHVFSIFAISCTFGLQLFLQSAVWQCSAKPRGEEHKSAYNTLKTTKWWWSLQNKYCKHNFFARHLCSVTLTHFINTLISPCQRRLAIRLFLTLLNCVINVSKIS